MVSLYLNKMAFKLINRMLVKSFKTYFSSGDINRIMTAGIIVIGDEILKGEVTDTNSTFLAIELHKMGLQLKKISVIGDNVKEVAKEVQHYSKSYDYVITSGGIGPTHDDITYEGVAAAFQEDLVLNAELKNICEKFYNTSDIKCPGMKLAFIPKSAKLNYNTDIMGTKMSYPTVSVNNVYIFPGIPELLTKVVYLNIAEDKIAQILHILVAEYPDVQFGSYPKFMHSEYKVKVTIESCNEESTVNAYTKLLKLVPHKYIVEKNV